MFKEESVLQDLVHKNPELVFSGIPDVSSIYASDAAAVVSLGREISLNHQGNLKDGTQRPERHADCAQDHRTRAADSDGRSQKTLPPRHRDQNCASPSEQIHSGSNTCVLGGTYRRPESTPRTWPVLIAFRSSPISARRACWRISNSLIRPTARFRWLDFRPNHADWPEGHNWPKNRIEVPEMPKEAVDIHSSCTRPAANKHMGGSNHCCTGRSTEEPAAPTPCVFLS